MDWPRRYRPRDELLDDYVILRGEGYPLRVIAERLGMRRESLERALCRARAAGDPRARVIGAPAPSATHAT